jgi:kynurenine formamidase
MTFTVPGSLSAITDARVIDLAQPLRRGIPVSPNHPAFEIALLRRHGDMMRPDGGSAANEIIVMGGHVGTHIDALAHVSHDGRLHGGLDATEHVSNAGFDQLGVDAIEPILARGVLLDIVAARGGPLSAGEEVTVEDLERAESMAGVSVGAGDAILIRTGWARFWGNPAMYLGQTDGAPGPGSEAGEWIASKSPVLAGGETVAFEQIAPAKGHAVLPVHRILLVENGIYIVENLNLDPLAAAGVHEFLFILAPLPIVGATGSPCRPLALIQGDRD